MFDEYLRTSLFKDLTTVSSSVSIFVRIRAGQGDQNKTHPMKDPLRNDTTILKILWKNHHKASFLRNAFSNHILNDLLQRLNMQVRWLQSKPCRKST